MQTVAQARDLERNRLAAWLPQEVVCGRLVRPFTLRTWALLLESNNAFTAASVPLTGDILQALWFVDLDFDGSNKPSARWLKQTAAWSHERAVVDFSAYLSRALADIPKGSAKRSSIEIASFVAYWVHRFASDYGWCADVVMTTPLQQLIQLERVGREAKGDGSAQQTDLVLAMLRGVK